MGRPPVKSSYKVRKAQRKAELQAEAEFYAQTFSQGKKTRLWIYSRLAKLLETLDPVETISIIGLSYFIKNGIEWGEDVFAQLQTVTPGELQTFPFSLSFWWRTLGFTENTEAEKLKEQMDSLPAEILQWLLSFAIATIVVRHPEAVVRLGGDIIGVAKGLLGFLG